MLHSLLTSDLPETYFTRQVPRLVSSSGILNRIITCLLKLPSPVFCQGSSGFFLSLLQKARMHVNVISIFLKAKVVYDEEITEYDTAEFGYNFALPVEMICNSKVAANSY